MLTKFTGTLPLTRETGSGTPPASTSAPQVSDDNFLLHMAPVSIGAFFFGSFHPNNEDRIQAQRALYKTSFLYRHFLQPGGLKAVIDEGHLTLTGKTTSGVVSLMAQHLAVQIMGKVEVTDDTSSSVAPVRGNKGSETNSDSEVRARLQLVLATDALLGSEEIEVQVTSGQVKISGRVNSSSKKVWGETLLRSVAPQAKISLQSTGKAEDRNGKPRPAIDDDSLQALAVTRVKLATAHSTAEIKVSSQRLGLSVSGTATSVYEKELIESIVKNTFGSRDFKSHLTVKS